MTEFLLIACIFLAMAFAWVVLFRGGARGGG
jgi:hypothetical protein